MSKSVLYALSERFKRLPTLKITKYLQTQSNSRAPHLFSMRILDRQRGRELTLTFSLCKLVLFFYSRAILFFSLRIGARTTPIQLLLLLVRFRLRQKGTTRSARNQSRPESPRVVRSRPESSGVVRSRPKPSGVVWSRSESWRLSLKSVMDVVCFVGQN